MEYKLKDAVKSANTGADAIQRAPIVEYETGIKCLRIGDISNKRKYVDWGYTNVNEENYKRYKIRKGNIIVARTGSTVGINKYINDEYNSVYNNGLIRLEIDEVNYNSKFIYYTMQTQDFKNYINGIAFGTTGQPNIQINDLLNFKVNYLPLEQQYKVVKVLSDIDEKIELNNKMNDNLYEIVDLLYKNDILDKYQTTHKLSELYDFQYGKGNNNPDNNGIYPVYGSNGIIGGYTEFNNEEAPVIGHIGANCGSLVFAFGKHFVTYNGVMCKIKCDGYRYFGYVSMRFLNFRNEIRGSSQPFISYDLLDNMKIPLPDSKIILEFESRIKSIIYRIKNNLEETKKLEKMRDALLPKLMNREIDLDKIEI